MSESNKLILDAASLASLLTTVADLVHRVEVIRAQTEENARQVWDGVTEDFNEAATGFAEARATVAKYQSARRDRTPAAPEDGAPVPGEGEPHALVTDA